MLRFQKSEGKRPASWGPVRLKKKSNEWDSLGKGEITILTGDESMSSGGEWRRACGGVSDGGIGGGVMFE